MKRVIKIGSSKPKYFPTSLGFDNNQSYLYK